MQRTDFDFDVIGGPSLPPLAAILPPRPPEPAPAPAAPSLDPAPRRPETPAP